MSIAPSPSSSEGARPYPSRAGWLARWAPVIVWAICISWFSSEAFSGRSTHRYIDPILRLLFGDLSPEQFRFVHMIIRKKAHFVEYAVLAVLMCRAIALPGLRPTLGMIVRPLALCALYAVLDELHQTFVANRAGSPLDVAVDVTGATGGALLFVWWRMSRTRAAPGAVAIALSARSRE